MNMSHMFKIIKADELSSNKSIVEIEKLKDISKESLSDCKTYGVWGLLGRKKDEQWKWLQVGQSNNIGLEIISDVQCISGEITQDNDRSYINQFGQVVNGYTYNVYLSAREQIYKCIGENFTDFIFVCVCCGEEYKDSKMAIEKYVAWKTRALFWRNGRAFKEPKANVQEPEGIENIEPSIKKVIDQMIGNFNK